MEAHRARCSKSDQGNQNDFEWAEFLHGGPSAT